MNIIQQSFFVCVGVIVGCLAHCPQLIYRYTDKTFNPSARNEWFLLSLACLPPIGCIFQEGLMRTGKKWWAKVGLGVYIAGTVLTMYMIILGGAVAANGMFPQFRVGHEYCGEQDIIGQWTSCFHLVGLGVELSGQVCAITLLIQCLRFTPEMIQRLIVDERLKMLAKEKEDEEREEREEDEKRRKGKKRICLDETREHDLVIFDMLDDNDEKAKGKTDYNTIEEVDITHETEGDKAFKEDFIQDENSKKPYVVDAPKDGTFTQHFIHNESSVRPYEVEGEKAMSFRDKNATPRSIKDSKQSKDSARQVPRSTVQDSETRSNNKGVSDTEAGSLYESEAINEAEEEEEGEEGEEEEKEDLEDIYK